MKRYFYINYKKKIENISELKSNIVFIANRKNCYYFFYI